jgi:glyoxylase-like metal-dependent hydrolase (beta-lactamase superfamily II)
MLLMLALWVQRLFWRPFETLCHRFPLIPLKLTVSEASPGILRIEVNNFVTRALARFGGGFEYAVIYLVDDELIFDTGFAWAARSLKKFFLGSSSKVRFLLNSHHHEDHTANNALLLKIYSEAALYTHGASAHEIMFPSRRPWYRRFLFGPETACATQDLPEEILLRSGRRLVPIHTPGHCDGHLCLWDPAAKALFAGDLYISATIDTQLQEVDGPAWIKSLAKVIALEPEILLDGHGIIIQGKEACLRQLTQKKDFLEAIRVRVSKAALEGPCTLPALTKKVFSGSTIVDCLSFQEGWMGLITAGDFSRSHLVKSFLRELN